jgi:hypothetical protein
MHGPAYFANVTVTSMFVDRQLSYSQSKQRMTSFRGQASQAKMMSLGGKLTALVCHLTKRVNKAEELTYLSNKTGYINLTSSLR